MHRVTLPDDLNVELDPRSKRGRWYRTFDPVKTALLVVDMQNHWVDARGASYVPQAAGIVPNINRLAAALRAKQGTVVWIQSTMTTEGPGAWAHFFDNLTENGEAERAELMEGHPMHALWNALDVHAGDLLIAKNRFSAFIEGASNLEALLRRERKVDTVLVTGVATNICCESTARDAMMRDFRTAMVEDANAARVDADHIAGLRTFAHVFGAVLTTDQVIARL